MLKRSSSLPQEIPGSQDWPLSRFQHAPSQGEKFSTYRAPHHLSIQAWKPLTSVRGAAPLGAAEEANPPNSLPLNVIPSAARNPLFAVGGRSFSSDIKPAA